MAANGLTVYHTDTQGGWRSTRYPGGYHCGAYLQVAQKHKFDGGAAVHLDGEYWMLPCMAGEVGTLPVCRRKCGNQLGCIAGQDMTATREALEVPST